jgi:hypothetical protein
MSRRRLVGLDRPPVVGALVVGAFAAMLSLARALHEPGIGTDFDQLHYAARALLGGVNPYGEIGPDRPFTSNWPLFYPLPAVLFTIPLAWLPAAAARVVFSAAAGALFGYAICRDGYWRLPACLSAAFLIAIWRTQWSPLLTAAYFLPGTAFLLAAKPNVGAAILAGVRTRRQLVWLLGIGGTLGVASLIVSPRWPLDWIAALRTKEYVSAPVTNWGGFLLPLALLRWRRPEARVFAALACVPQTPSLYDLLPLCVVPRGMRGMTALALLAHALFLTIVAMGPFPDYYAYTHRLEQLAVVFVWLPALGMILVRPNVWTDGTAGAAAVAVPVTLRQRVEALPRIDALLLVAAAACSVFLIWVTLATRRA